MTRPNPAASAALLAQGIDDALLAHGVPPRPKRNDLTESRRTHRSAPSTFPSPCARSMDRNSSMVNAPSLR